MFRKSLTRRLDSAGLYLKRKSGSRQSLHTGKDNGKSVDWKAEILAEVDEDDWKYELIKTCREKWKGELIFFCKQERTGLLVNSCNKTQAEIIVEEQDHEPYWKLQLLSKARSEWESDSILQIESRSLAECLVNCEQSWLQDILFQAITEIESHINRKKSYNLSNAKTPMRKRSSMRKSHHQRKKSEQSQSHVQDLTSVPKDDTKKSQEQAEGQIQAYEKVSVSESELDLDVYVQSTTEFPQSMILDPSRVQILAMAKTRWQALMIKSIMYTRYNFTDKADIILNLERDQALGGGKLIAEAPVWKMDFLKEVVHSKPICTWKLTFILGCSDEWRCSLISKAKNYKIAAFIFSEETSRLKAEVVAKWMQNQDMIPRWKMALVSDCIDYEPLLNDVLDCREEWRAKLIVKVDEDWKRGILKQEDVEQWRSNFIVNESIEWKCRILYSRCVEKWRAQIIKGINEEWKAELILQAQEQWRAELMKDIHTEWKLLYILRATEHWRAKMVEMMKDADQATSREMLNLDRIPDEQSALELFGRHGSASNLFL